VNRPAKQPEKGLVAHFGRNSVCIFRRNRRGKERRGERAGERIGFVLQNRRAALERIGFVLNFPGVGWPGSL
jgi:hypothetical protein